MSTIVDSYSETNQGDAYVLNSESYAKQYISQSFTGSGGTLDSVKFYLKKAPGLTGNATAYIFEHSGTFGTSSLPTGSALATSANLDVSSISESYGLVTLTFSGVNKITLTNSTNYCLALFFNGSSGTTFLYAGIDVSSPSHGGNAGYNASSTWTAESGKDVCFYVYKDDATVKDIIGCGIIPFSR